MSKYFSPQHRLNLSNSLKGRKFSEESRKKMSASHTGLKIPSMTGSKHPLWQGDKVNCHAAHKWVRSRKIKPVLCEICKRAKKLQLSSKNHAYTRDLEEYQYLCFSCHRKWDIHHNGFCNHKKMQNKNRKTPSVE